MELAHSDGLRLLVGKFCLEFQVRDGTYGWRWGVYVLFDIDKLDVANYMINVGDIVPESLGPHSRRQISYLYSVWKLDTPLLKILWW